MELYLGIDTSCYTTSIAAVAEGQLFFDFRLPLRVPAGQRGLRQAEMVFQHVKNLQEIAEKMSGPLANHRIVAVAASTRPRPVTGSYMPVFEVARMTGLMLAAASSIPFYSVSHQEGHLRAGLWSAGGPEVERFLAVHISGGTTEILAVERKKTGMEIEIIGGSNDLHAGQFVDRVGVALGLPFPAGPSLEKLAAEWTEEEPELPVAVKGMEISFSGPESQARRWIEQGYPPAAVARAVEKCVVESLVRVLKQAIRKGYPRHVLLVGGVAANVYLRRYLGEKLKDQGATLYFAAPVYSTDNAVGVAFLAWDRSKS